MTSFGIVTIVKGLMDRFSPAFVIQGQLYHRFRSLLPIGGVASQWLYKIKFIQFSFLFFALFLLKE